MPIPNQARVRVVQSRPRPGQVRPRLNQARPRPDQARPCPDQARPRLYQSRPKPDQARPRLTTEAMFMLITCSSLLELGSPSECNFRNIFGHFHSNWALFKDIR